jgi:hypothetical protein
MPRFPTISNIENYYHHKKTITVEDTTPSNISPKLINKGSLLY